MMAGTPPSILIIKELAEYEKMSDLVIADEAMKSYEMNAHY